MCGLNTAIQRLEQRHCPKVWVKCGLSGVGDSNLIPSTGPRTSTGCRSKFRPPWERADPRAVSRSTRPSHLGPDHRCPSAPRATQRMEPEPPLVLDRRIAGGLTDADREEADRFHLQAMESMTRLRVLASSDLVRAAEELHLADHRARDVALVGSGIP